MFSIQNSNLNSKGKGRVSPIQLKTLQNIKECTRVNQGRYSPGVDIDPMQSICKSAFHPIRNDLF